MVTAILEGIIGTCWIRQFKNISSVNEKTGVLSRILYEQDQSYGQVDSGEACLSLSVLSLDFSACF